MVYEINRPTTDQWSPPIRCPVVTTIDKQYDDGDREIRRDENVRSNEFPEDGGGDRFPRAKRTKDDDDDGREWISNDSL